MPLQPFSRCLAGVLVPLLLLAAAGLVAWAQDSEPVEPPPVDDAILNNRAPFLVVAQVNHPNLDYREGDNFSVRVASETDAFVYVLYQQADGKIYQVFPNKHQPNNKLAARQAVDIPAKDDLFRWVVGPPFGKERVKVVASKAELDVLSDPRINNRRFNPVSTRSFKGVELELGDEEPTGWAETDIEIHTYPRGQQLVDRGAKRYGVFFGVSKHQFREEILEATRNDPWDPDLSACHRDAQKLGAAMHEIGRLNDFKTFTNDQATKANMQEAITQWLPRVSRPGDTVFISFSGHTGKMPDLDGDEPDGEDEYMVPHDFVDMDILGVLADQALNDEIADPAVLGRVVHLAELCKDAGGNEGNALIHETCISDDLLARWLQRLAGRQVILIMDTCHGGGYASQGASRSSRLAPVNMFDRELRRLRDMGQPNQALLAAALADQEATEFEDKSMGTLTYFVVNAIENARGPVRLEQVFAHCKESMRVYFQGEDSDDVHEPFMANYCTSPVYFKP